MHAHNHAYTRKEYTQTRTHAHALQQALAGDDAVGGGTAAGGAGGWGLFQSAWSVTQKLVRNGNVL